MLTRQAVKAGMADRMGNLESLITAFAAGSAPIAGGVIMAEDPNLKIRATEEEDEEERKKREEEEAKSKSKTKAKKTAKDIIPRPPI